MDENINNKSSEIKSAPHIDSLYREWFLSYASYVNLERAIPSVFDGLKPVQRRILHAMKEQDDGRFTKVANLIGQTMQYHPHGDASIGEALVNMGQKDLLIDTQGNWGNIYTGDRAAAPRYIEARLSPFAIHACFHDQNTEWQLSYDGRKREPIFLPVKFPLILAQGTEGIGVGMATTILPHNFVELCEASVNVIKGKKVVLFPDFPTGGYIDVSNYQQGVQGGKVRCRAKIDKLDAKTIVIRSVPFGTTTSGLMERIVKENESGKIKIKKIIDNTASDVEIIIELAPGVSADITIDALYAFTNCETTLSPLGCCIIDDKPMFIGVDEMLRLSTQNTMTLMLQELEIKKKELEDKWHYTSLEKIFFEEQIYKELEKKHETWELVLQNIEKGFEPFLKILKRSITRQDIERLTEKPVRRIYKLDIESLKDKIKSLEDEIKELVHHIEHLDEYAINYFQDLIKRFGKGKERKAEIKTFDQIEAKSVIINNQKLFVNKEDGFVGYGLKKDEFVCDCTDIDDIIVIRKDGKMLVTKIADKKYVGKDILYASVWKKDDDRTIYNLIYTNISSNKNFVKRFAVTSITRDREYDVAKGEKCKVIYFSANPNGEAEVVNIKLSQSCTARVKVFDFDFSSVIIKGRDSLGNIITTYPISKIDLKKKGVSTIGGTHLWFEKTIGRLNKNQYGQYLGEFFADDMILVLMKDGSYILTSYELTNKYDPDSVLRIEKFDAEKPVQVLYLDGESQNYYVKRFLIEQKTENRPYVFISEHSKSKLLFATTHIDGALEYEVLKGKSKEKLTQQLVFKDFIEIKGWKSQGNRLTQFVFNGKFKEVVKEPEVQFLPTTTKLEPAKEESATTTIVEKSIQIDFSSGEQGTLFD